MSHLEGDNDGRRTTLRNLFSNDPFYRRIKDACLIIFAVIVAARSFGVSISGHDRELDRRDEQQKTERRIVVLEVTMPEILHRLERIESKLDRNR